MARGELYNRGARFAEQYTALWDLSNHTADNAATSAGGAFKKRKSDSKARRCAMSGLATAVLVATISGTPAFTAVAWTVDGKAQDAQTHTLTIPVEPRRYRICAKSTGFKQYCKDAQFGRGTNKNRLIFDLKPES